jgi:hypothetical protein
MKATTKMSLTKQISPLPPLPGFRLMQTPGLHRCMCFKGIFFYAETSYATFFKTNKSSKPLRFLRSAEVTFQLL